MRNIRKDFFSKRGISKHMATPLDTRTKLKADLEFLFFESEILSLSRVHVYGKTAFDVSRVRK